MNLETASPEWKTIAVSDGTAMRVYIARPKPGPAKVPAVLVLQEAFGVNAHIQDVAGRFAREGFLAIAPELYHRTAEGFDAPYSDFASAIPHLQAITTANLVADLQATFDQVVKEPRADPGQVAVVGYCLGGRAAFIANAVLPLRAAVSYYGGRIHLLLDQAKDQHGPLLLFWGGQDEHIPAEQIRPIGHFLGSGPWVFLRSAGELPSPIGPAILGAYPSVLEGLRTKECRTI